jgi:RNase P protein component
VRRRVREIIRLAESGIVPGFDIVIVVRAKTVYSSFQEQKSDLYNLLSAGGLLSDGFFGAEKRCDKTAARKSTAGAE